MPRPRNTTPSKSLEIAVPLTLRNQVEQHLFSEALERIPQGAFSQFFCGLASEFFNQSFLDLAPYIANTPVGVHVVRGPKLTIQALERALKGQA